MTSAESVAGDPKVDEALAYVAGLRVDDLVNRSNGRRPAEALRTLAAEVESLRALCALRPAWSTTHASLDLTTVPGIRTLADMKQVARSIADEQPMHRLTVTIEDLSTGISTTITGKAKDVQVSVEGDIIADPIDLMDPALPVTQQAVRRHISLNADMVGDYLFSSGKETEVERLRAIENRAKAASVAGVDAIVRDAALHILNYKETSHA